MISQGIIKTIKRAKQRILRYEQLVGNELASAIIAFLKRKTVTSYRSNHFRYKPIAAIHIVDKGCTMMDIEFNGEQFTISKKFLANDQNAKKYLLDILDKGKENISIKKLNRYRFCNDEDKEKNYFNEVLFTVNVLSVKTWGVFAGVYGEKGHIPKKTLQKIRRLDLARRKLSEMEEKIKDIKKAHKQKGAAIKKATSQCKYKARSKEREFKQSYSSLIKQTTMAKDGNKR